ncbi:hypothetical protein [Yinghuangia soli]|uniref:Uncharacterized protein n=1 Tax=Yinghuangia soli TaxID=2908204 RepID=A0AA41PWQ6_9ACTN|nr:hypothetical protein [Yinghuangia soli]MCF2527126.1 hypothetical protein [Yinghuangia soli]
MPEVVCTLGRQRWLDEGAAVRRCGFVKRLPRSLWAGGLRVRVICHLGAVGNSRAYPVFRTIDAAEAYLRARQLVQLLEYVEDDVAVSVELRTVADARRMAAVLPGAARVWSSNRAAYVDLRSAAEDEIAAELPIHVLADIQAGAAEETVLGALGEGTASMQWGGRWPEDSDSESDPHPKYDGVQVAFHDDRAQGGEWVAHHTVFVHVTKWGDSARARSLAAHIGSSVLGDAQLGI